MAPLFWTPEHGPPPPSAAIPLGDDRDDHVAEVSEASSSPPPPPPGAPPPGLASRVLQYAGQLWADQGRHVGHQVAVVLSQPPPLAPPPALAALKRVVRALKEKQD